jgi:hypothetical protein
MGVVIWVENKSVGAKFGKNGGGWDGGVDAGY